MENLVRALLLCLACAVILSCSTPPETDAPGRIAAPVEAVLVESTQQVQELLQNLLVEAQQDSASGVRRGELGMAYEANGYLDAAFRSYGQAEALDPDGARWPYYQALILARRGEQQQALNALDRTMSTDPAYAPAWMWYATWSLDVGLVDQADAAFTNAQALGIGAPARIGQARVRLHRHQPRQAVVLLEQLIRDFDDPRIFQLLGRAYREAGRLDDARIALARGKSAGPLYWEDDWQEQKQTYAINFNARANHAQRLLEFGRAEAALEIFESLLQEQPDNEWVISQLSGLYQRLGETERAFWMLRSALEKNPDYYGLYIDIADFYQRRGEHNTALEHLDRAIALNPLRAETHVRKGLLLRQLGQLEDALAAFDAALSHDAGTPQVFLYAGQAEAALNRWSRASQRFEESIRIDPAFGPGYLNLAGSLAHAGRFGEAQVALQRAEQLATPQSELQAAFEQLISLQERAN